MPYPSWALSSSMFFRTLQCTPLKAARLLQPVWQDMVRVWNILELWQRRYSQSGVCLTLKTMCSSILNPAFPVYLLAMLARERSNILAPVSVQIACTSIFLPTPLGPAIMRDLTWGAFSWGPPQGCRLVQSPGGNVNMRLTCTGPDTWCPDTSSTSYAAMCVCV